jgi:glycosyltransferase involved in cell wall biosynthesis
LTALRIVHVDPERGFAGGETQVLALAAHLHERGHEQLLAADPDGQLAARAARAGLRVAPIRCRYDLDPRAGLALRRLVGSYAPDVVHLHTARAFSLVPYLPGSVVRVVTRRMDYPPRGARAYVRWLYGQADEVIAISAAVRAALVSRGIPGERIAIVPSGVDVARFADTDRDGARHALGIDRTTLVVALVAALVERKGQRVLLEALALLAARGTRPLCLFAGVGPDGDRLLARAAELGLGPQVRWLGRVDDVTRVLAAADVTAAPSLAEGLGVAVIEAMAASRPVIASAVGGIPESVRDGVEGLLVPPGDPGALADALERCLADPGLRARLGAAGHRRAAEFSTSAMARGTESIYVRALEGSRPARRRRTAPVAGLRGGGGGTEGSGRKSNQVDA